MKLLTEFKKRFLAWSDDNWRLYHKRSTLQFLTYANFAGSLMWLAWFLLQPSLEHVLLAGSNAVGGFLFAFLADRVPSEQPPKSQP